MKVSFIQGLVNLMTLNLKKNNIIYFNTSKSEKIQEFFYRKVYGNLTILIKSTGSIKLVNFFPFR